MKRAETYKKRFEAQGRELKELQAAHKELQDVRDRQRDSINAVMADNNTLQYENTRLAAKVDALQGALVVVQAHFSPMQRREFDNRGWAVTSTDKGLLAKHNP